MRRRPSDSDHRMMPVYGSGAEYYGTLDGMQWARGNYIEAERMFDQSRQQLKRAFGSDDTDTLSSMNNLASTYWNQGRWAEAEKMEVEVLEMSRRVLGDGPSPHTDQYEQPGIHVRESRSMGGGGEDGNGGDGDAAAGAGRGASRHTEQHEQLGIHVPASRPMGGGGDDGYGGDGGRVGGCWARSIPTH